MGTREGFNAEAAKRAMESVMKDAEELFAKFEQNHKVNEEHFDVNGGKDIALGGNLANAALAATEEMRTQPFNEFKSAMDFFMSHQVDSIISNNVSTEDSARSIYSSN